ncbi:hypothetical protein LCGC14_2989900 [marine sediment metagenome]|uniref:Uncharacterized protein n=1 Tax=marine sediment metagenome TaxID=412755 RepID=A0A0F8X4X1_9ZZZZ
MGSVKNMVRGTIFTVIYVVFTIIVPLVTFTLLFNFVVQGLPLEFEQQDYNNIIFWVVAFGLMISGCAFFKYSSPKQSIRRGIIGLIQVLVNCLYLWSYKFSGAAQWTFVIIDFGILFLDVEQMLLMYMGLYSLTIVLKVYDIFDFTINRKKIRENRMKE